MPVGIRKIGGKFRLVEPGGAIAKNKAGTPVDGGGHESREAALKQMRAINMRERGQVVDFANDEERANVLGISVEQFKVLAGIDAVQDAESDSDILDEALGLRDIARDEDKKKKKKKTNPPGSSYAKKEPIDINKENPLDEPKPILLPEEVADRARKHQHTMALKIDETPNQFRVRMSDPGRFTRFRVKQVRPGLQLIVGRPKGSTKTEVQAFRFDKSKFTRQQVQDFMKRRRKEAAVIAAVLEAGKELQEEICAESKKKSGKVDGAVPYSTVPSIIPKFPDLPAVSGTQMEQSEGLGLPLALKPDSRLDEFTRRQIFKGLKPSVSGEAQADYMGGNSSYLKQLKDSKRIHIGPGDVYDQVNMKLYWKKVPETAEEVALFYGFHVHSQDNPFGLHTHVRGGKLGGGHQHRASDLLGRHTHAEIPMDLARYKIGIVQIDGAHNHNAQGAVIDGGHSHDVSNFA